MENQKILIGTIIALIAFLILCIASMTQFGQPIGNGKYPSGRDTYRSFGDGQIQIAWISQTDKILYDVKNQKTLLDKIIKWKKRGKRVFLRGTLTERDKFLLIDLENNEITQYENINEIPDKYKKQFEKL
ncbi:MAG: hypothetical protein ACMUJM_08270 [bacterium]